MNELIKKGIKEWNKIKLSNLKYYYELLVEDVKRFKYPPRDIKKYTLNMYKLKCIGNLLKCSNKLHIGCGGVKINGFINIDAFKTPATDFVCEIEDLPKYIKANSIRLIYSSHTLEHFSRRDSIQMLKMFYDFLEPLGELRISVPDLMKLSDVIKAKKWEANDMHLLQGVLMGGQETRYNYHKTIFWFDLLKQILLDTGFKDINEYTDRSGFLGDIEDGSTMAGQPLFGNISLNVKAIK